MDKQLLVWVMALCPRAFRQRYQVEILQVYATQKVMEPGMSRGPLLFLRTAAGLLLTAVSLRLEPLWADICFAFRQMRQRPGHALIAVLTLAMGIGFSTALFGLFNAVLIKPLPLFEADRLVMVWNRYGEMTTAVSTADFHYRRDHSESLSELAAVGAAQSVALTGDGEPVSVSGVAVSANFFEVAGARTIRGRGFMAGEDEIGKGQVAVISNGLWQRRFGGDESVLGQTIIVDGEARVVVGIMPDGFNFPHQSTELWHPLEFPPDKLDYSQHGNEYLGTFGRLRPGMSAEEAQRDINRLANTFKQLVPDRIEYLDNSQWGGLIQPVEEYLRGDVRPILTTLLGAAVLVLLLVCANVTSLQLARVVSRQDELAVRASLGASRARIMRQLLTEIGVLVCTGGLPGMLLIWGLEMLALNLTPDLIEPGDLLVGRVALFGAVAMLATGIICGLVPANRFRGVSSLSARGVLGTRKTQALRRLSVIAQTAIAVVLVSAASAAVVNLTGLLRVDPGFETQGRFAFRLKLPAARYEEASQRAALVADVESGLNALPGIISVGTNGSLPLLDDNWTASFNVEHFTPGPGQPPPNFEIRPVSPGYRDAVGIPLIAGRDFGDQDHNDAPGVALIDEKLARTYFSDIDPLGQRIGRGNDDDTITWHEIIGVVGHVRNDGLEVEGGGQVYLPYAQAPVSSPWLVIQGAPGGAGAKQIRNAVAGVLYDLDPLLPLDRFLALEEGVSATLAKSRLSSALLGTFALLSFILAMVGLYSLVSFSVSTRTSEFGLKMALGAHAPKIVSTVIKDGFKLAAYGVGLGAVLAYWLQELLSSAFAGFEAASPLTLILVSLGLCVTAAIASAIPARRAARISPAKALQHA